MSGLMHSLILIPAAAFVVAAGTGIAIRKFRARDDKQFRHLKLG